MTSINLALGGFRAARSSLRSSEQHASHQSASSRVSWDTLIFRDSIFVEARGCTITTTKTKHEYHVIREVSADTIRDTLYRTITKNEVRERVVQKRGFVFKIGIVAIALCAIFMLYNMFRYFRAKNIW